MFFFQNTTQLLQDSLFIKTSTTSTWSSRRTPKTGEAEKIKRNAIDGRRQLTCDDAIPTSGQHILLHRTLRFPHSFRRRRLPSIPTLAFTCHPAWATILRTTVYTFFAVLACTSPPCSGGSSNGVLRCGTGCLLHATVAISRSGRISAGSRYVYFFSPFPTVPSLRAKILILSFIFTVESRLEDNHHLMALEYTNEQESIGFNCEYF